MNNETPEEKTRRLGVPLIPKRPDFAPPPYNPIIAICGQCGLELSRVMGYVCQQKNCPTGLGGTQCLLTH